MRPCIPNIGAYTLRRLRAVWIRTASIPIRCTTRRSRLHFLVESRRGSGCSWGPGRGKSLVLRVFAEQLKGTPTRVVAMNLLGTSAQEVLENLAIGWGCFVDPGMSRAELWRQLSDRLIEQRLMNQASVLLLDDADEAEPAAITQIERLAHLDATADGRLTIVLACVPTGTPTCRCGSWSWAICESTSTAGNSPTPRATLPICWPRPVATCRPSARRHWPGCTSFRRAARQINQIADLALAAAAGQRLELVDPRHGRCRVRRAEGLLKRGKRKPTAEIGHRAGIFRGVSPIQAVS